MGVVYLCTPSWPQPGTMVVDSFRRDRISCAVAFGSPWRSRSCLGVRRSVPIARRPASSLASCITRCWHDLFRTLLCVARVTIVRPFVLTGTSALRSLVSLLEVASRMPQPVQILISLPLMEHVVMDISLHGALQAT